MDWLDFGGQGHCDLTKHLKNTYADWDTMSQNVKKLIRQHSKALLPFIFYFEKLRMCDVIEYILMLIHPSVI